MPFAGRLLPFVLLLACHLPYTLHAQIAGDPVYIPNTPAIAAGPVLPYGDLGMGMHASVHSGCNTCNQRRGPVRSLMHNRLCTRCQRRGCCGECQVAAPCTTCNAAPVVQPSLVPSLTYREVPQTMMRREAYAVQVPVTTYKTVAVTGYQQQTRYRDVPYTVMQKVPQVQYTPSYSTAMMPTGCNTCNSGLFTSPAYTTSMLDPAMMTAPDYSTAQAIQPYPYAPQQTIPQIGLAPQAQQDIPELGNLHVPVPTADPNVAIPRTSSVDKDGWQVIRKNGAVSQTASNYDGDPVPAASGKFTGVKSSSSIQSRSSVDSVVR